MKLYMFRTVRLSIIRSLFTVHSAMVYAIQVCRQLSSKSICSCSKVILVHLVGFITKKFVTMHGHMNVNLTKIFICCKWHDSLANIPMENQRPPEVGTLIVATIYEDTFSSACCVDSSNGAVYLVTSTWFPRWRNHFVAFASELFQRFFRR